MASHLRQEQDGLDQARACLEEAYELSLTQHFPWQRSEICYRLEMVAMDKADNLALQARAVVVSEGSTQDWLGPAPFLLAHKVCQRNASIGQVACLY